ncbi:MAG: DUF192 domain-containing protein [Solirubrobacterales bacterium]
MKLVNEISKKTISENLIRADNYYKRLKGLMFTDNLPENQALHIIPCNEVHTFFMKYNIDVLYIDKNNKIISMDEELKPGKIGRFVKGSNSVIELPPGKIKKECIEVGQVLSFSEE